MKTKMKPCDCKDERTVMMLQEQGIRINDRGITVEPNSVVMTGPAFTVKIPMGVFQAFAEWYLTPQELKIDGHTCAYSKAMNQPYPRRCIHCGKPEGSDSLTVSK